MLKNIFYINKPQGKLLFVSHYDLNKYHLYPVPIQSKEFGSGPHRYHTDLSRKTISFHSETINMTYINKLLPIIYAKKCLLVRHDCILHKTYSYMKHKISHYASHKTTCFIFVLLIKTKRTRHHILSLLKITQLQVSINIQNKC